MCQRLTLVIALGLISCGAATQSQAAAQPSNPPNILVILVDDLGYGDLSAYGATDLKTPHIDHLIESGMRFDHFYANCPVCSPTRAALLSGKYPDKVGVPGVIRTHPKDSWGFLSPDTVLLPKALRPASYHTAIVGKWHLGLESPNTPNERGFDHFHGFLGDMMDDYYHHRRHGNNYMRHNDQEIDPPGHATDLFSRWAIDYLNARKKDGKRFFLYLAYNAPHTPIQPPTHWLEKVKQREPNISEKRARLVALIEHMDHGIGDVLASLQKNDQTKATLVIFTSDNGGQLNVGGNCGANRGGKQDMYEGGIRVPFCASWPGVIEPGSRSDALGMTMDFYPTLCEVSGVPVPQPVDGVSLLPTFLGRSQTGLDRTLIWVRREGNMRYQGRDYYALRKGLWKLVQNTPFEAYQLYHLGRDPMETNNLAATESNQFRTLVRQLMRHIQAAGQTPWQHP
ncbi:MAG: Arylsulfatase [Verrucomicrobia subdivision 3 bacterium]|nr:Arylsulfatase [Limisphaerales bacterium]MCS1417068.1 Arylsulfatase [Limisphaerales bacterium]